MKYNLIEEEKWHRKLEITIPEDDVAKKFDEVYKVLKTEAKIPGFRPGKAPINIIKSRYGKLAEKEVLETMVPDAYSNAVKESGIFPISEPEFSMIKVEDGKPISFTAEFDVKPIIEVQRYKEFTLKRQSDSVPDIDVEKAFQHILDRFSSLKTVEGEASDGNLVIVDMEALDDPDDVLKEKEIKDFSYELNREATLPEFYDALVGAKAGDERQVKVTYPDDYYEKTMAGKSLEFKVKVKEVKEIVRPDMNQEFFKQFGEEVKSEDELKGMIRKDLESRRKQEVEADIREQAIKSVISANDFDLPQSLVENYLDSVVEDFKKQQKDQEIDEKQIREQYKPMAIRFIRWNLLYHKIAEAEKIKITKEDTDNWLQSFADKSNITVEQAKEFLAAQKKIEDVKETLLEDKVLEVIIGSSTIEDM